MKKRYTLMACLIAMIAVMLAAVGCVGGTTDKITLNVPEVPTSVNVGETVTIPAATATAGSKDISDYILVSVDLLKQDNTTVHRSIVHEQPGNVEQSFVATDNERLTYKILYVVEYEGAKDEKTFTLTAVADTEAPVLTVDIDENETLKGKGGQEIKLPGATATDNPGNKDLTSRIEARLYEVLGDKVSTSPLATYADFTQEKVVRIPSGNYELAYTVSDVAGNKAAKTYRIPVEIAQPDEVNLIKDKANFAHNNQVGKSWFNDRGELAFGNTAPFADFSSAVGWSLNTTKIYEQYVGITFNADPITANGQWFYTFAARAGKNRESLPTYATSEWPPYMYMRIGATLEVFAKDNVNMGERAEFGDKNALTSGINGTTLLNGEDHVMYLQYLNYGTFDAENPENDVKPAILFRGWVDTDPSSEVSFQYSVIPGDQDGWGQLERSTFAMLWEQSAAGWFSVSATPQQNMVSDDDHMRIKAVVVYDKDTTEFNTDITPPKFTITSDGENAYDAETVRAINKPFELPFVTATEVNDEDIQIVITKPDGTTETLRYDDETYTPAAEGIYSILYEVTDAAGNCAYKTIMITAAVEDTEKPTLTLVSADPISAKVGETVTLSEATAQSASGADLTDAIVVEVKGPEHYILEQGGSFIPKTPGTYTVTYRVKNNFGIYADEVAVTLTVQTNLTQDTNLVGANGLNSSSSTVVLSGAENIYDARITTVIKLETLGLVLLNIRGEDGNLGWPDGFTLGIFGAGGDARNIAISYNGHNDSHYYANTTFDTWAYRNLAEIVLEWQLKTVTVNGQEYIRAQVWVQGELLTWAKEGCSQSDVTEHYNLEDEIQDYKAVYLAVADIPSRYAENIYSTQFFFLSHNSSTTIKEFYINASEAKRTELLETYPGPQAPEGYEDVRTYNEDGSLKTVTVPEATKTIAAGADVCLRLATDVNESLMVVSAVRSGGTKNSLAIGITGSENNSSWGVNQGITILMGNDGFNGGYLTMGGRSNNTVSALAWSDAEGALTNYTWAYKLTYVNSKDAGYVKEVKLQIWGAQYGQKPVQLGALLWDNEYVKYNKDYITYDADTKTWTFKAGAFANKAAMSPDCSVCNPGSQNDCVWKIEVSTLASIDDYAVHEHTFNEAEWATDEVGHWHAATCEHSTEKGSYAAHEYDADYKCTVCEYQHEHTYATEWSYDETNHWHAVTCGHDVAVKDQAAHDMVDGEGVDYQVCSVCEYKATPEPEGIADVRTYDENGALKTVTIPEASKKIEAGADVCLRLATDVNESLMVVSAVRKGGTKSSLSIGITGPNNTSSWGVNAGITILMGNDGFDGGWLTMGGRSNNQISALAWSDADGALTNYTWAYKLTYVQSAPGYVKEVKLQIWGAQYGKKPVQLGALIWEDAYVKYNKDYITYDVDTKTWTFKPEAFASAEAMAPDCSVCNPGSQNDGAWQIGVSTLASIDDYTEPEGFEDVRTYNENGAMKAVTIPEDKKKVEIAAGADVYHHLATDVNESLMVVQAQRVGGTKSRFMIGLSGSADSSWGVGCGLNIYMGDDGANGTYLKIGGTEISVLGWGGTTACNAYTWAYKLTFVEGDAGYVTAVKLQIWGADIGAKPVPMGAIFFQDKYVRNLDQYVSYDVDTKTWTFKTGAFASAAAMTPDCSVYNPGQQNDGVWQIKVSTFADINDYSEGTGLKDPRTQTATAIVEKYAAGFDISAGTYSEKMATDVNESLMAINVDFGENTGDVFMGIGIMGTTSNSYGTGLLLIKIDAKWENRAVLCFHGLSGNDCKPIVDLAKGASNLARLTIAYKLTFVDADNDGYCEAVQLEMWMAHPGETAQKVAIAPASTFDGKLSYADGVYTFDSSMFGSGVAFQPTCFFVAPGDHHQRAGKITVATYESASDIVTLEPTAPASIDQLEALPPVTKDGESA